MSEIFSDTPLFDGAHIDRQQQTSSLMQRVSAGLSMTGQDFSHARLSEIQKHTQSQLSGLFNGALLIGSYWDRVRIPGFQLKQGNLTGATWFRVALPRAHIVDTSLGDLRRDFEAERVYYASMHGRKEPVIDLSGSRLDNVTARNANFSGRRLGQRSADIMWTVSLKGATVTGGDWSGVDLSGVDLTGTTFVGVDLTGAKIAGAAMHETKFINCKLRKMKEFSGVAVDCHFDGSDFSGTDISDLIFMAPETGAVQMPRARLDKAIIDPRRFCYDALAFNFEGAKLPPRLYVKNGALLWRKPRTAQPSQNKFRT